ncbi:MAG TPA: hypothetical protein VIM98_03670 [Dyella sp.]|uniref:DUF7931 domain-containing protein n=1 Tax=Dyella sp. TaxID=1869338 RepID=UPI002F920685
MPPIASRDELTAARLAVLQQARYRLSIYQPMLTADIFSDTAEMTQLRRIATAGRGAEIRILLHDPQSVLRDGHRLVALAQRLSSTVLVRVPTAEQDLGYGSAYMFDDVGGYVFQPEASRPQGRTALLDRGGQVPLIQHFNEVWERSERASALLPLGI